MAPSNALASTVEAIRPVLPARDFELSKRFYTELGFALHELVPDKLAELRLGSFSFLLQNHYVQQWADNVAIHLRVRDARRWWDHIVSLDLPKRYGVKTVEPKQEMWGLVACVIDPSGLIWAGRNTRVLFVFSVVSFLNCQCDRTLPSLPLVAKRII